MQYTIKDRFIKFIRLILFILLSVLLLIKILFPRETHIFVFNHTPMLVASSSMEPSFQTNSLIIIKKSRVDELSEGDVIAYKSVALKGRLAFHRIIRINEEGIFTKGDNNNLEDNQVINKDNLVGKCVFHTNLTAKYLSLIKKPQGFIYLIIVPIELCIIFYLFKGRGIYYEAF